MNLRFIPMSRRGWKPAGGATGSNSPGWALGASTPRGPIVVSWHGPGRRPRGQAGDAVRMNTDYYHIGPTFQRADGGWAFGFFTGAVCRCALFSRRRGAADRRPAQTTHLVDEQVLDMPWESNFVGFDARGGLSKLPMPSLPVP